MPETYESRASSGSARVRSASVTQAFNSETSVAVERYGVAKPTGLALTLYHNGALVESESYNFGVDEETGGRDLIHGVYVGARNAAADLGQYQGTQPGFLAKPSYDADLGDAYPSATATDGPGVGTEQRARTALAAAGYSLVVYDGPGIWRKEPEDDTGDIDTLSFLQSTLLATGARYWIEASTVYIDGRSIPVSFSLPSGDEHLITAHTWADELALESPVDPEDPALPEPTPEELELPPEPVADDYLSQCPDYTGTPPGYVPPEPTPEEPLSGTYEYVMEAGIGLDRTRVTRKNTYSAGSLQRTEATEEGVISTPAGNQFKLRLKAVTAIIYHPDCPSAILQQRDSTYIAPEMSAIYKTQIDPNTGQVGTATRTDVEQAEDLYNALLSKTNGDGLYLQNERVENFEYHLEGWLKRSIEVNRELNVLSYRAPQTPVENLQLDISYNTRTRSVVFEPQMGGQWATYTLERQTENVVVYETSAGSSGAPDTAAPATVQRVSRSTPRVEGGNQAPPQMNCPPPAPEEPETGYFWDFGDGTSRNSGSYENHEYAAEGVYNVSVTYTFLDGRTLNGSAVAATPETGQPSTGSSGGLIIEVFPQVGRRFGFRASRVISCTEQKQEEFDRDHDEWEEEKVEAIERYRSERVNILNVSKRAHTVTFGVIRPNLKLNDSYGGGLIAAVSHSYSDGGQTIQAGTTLTIWERI